VETLSDGTIVIQTNAEFAWARYVKQVTDTTKFSPLFVVCLSWLLASYIAGPITKDLNKKEASYKMFLKEFGAAAVSNALFTLTGKRQRALPLAV
jgi:hypothetical protein